MDEAPPTLTPTEMAELDAQYQPFPPFSEWPKEPDRLQLWESRLSRLEAAAGETDEEALRRAIDVAVRAAAWDTGAIEGLYTTNRGVTLTIATGAAAWEREIDSHGADARALFDAQLATYELVLDVATRRQPITQARIRKIHEVLTEPQETYIVYTEQGPREDPLPRGQYKSHPNHVELNDGSRHAYAPVADTQAEMSRLVDELTSDAFETAHPLVQAAYAHYALVAIHPFADGNGRVARALASVYLYRDARVPLVIFADDRPRYFDALAAADKGAYQPFMDFIADAGIATVELVTDSLRTSAVPSPQETVAQFRELLTVQGDLTYTDIDGVANGLLAPLQTAVSEEIAELELPGGVQVIMSSGNDPNVGPPDGYRPVLAAPGMFVGINLSAPASSQANREARFYVFVSRSREEDAELFWVIRIGSEDGVTFSLRDVYPRPTIAAEQRLRLLARRVIGGELQALLDEARRSLIASGYVVDEQNPD